MDTPLILGYIGVLVFLLYKSIFKKSLPLPPGPPANILLGHLPHIPSENQHILFYEWGKIYGDVIHLHFLGRSVIILNSVQAAVDLLEKRSRNYSDRPRLMVSRFMGFARILTLMPYGKQFQLHRKMVHQYLTANKCVKYRAIQTREAHVLLQNLLSDEQGRERFLQRFSAAIIVKLAFGHQVTSDDDPYIKIARDAIHAVDDAGPPGSTPIDFLPFLQHFPSWFPGTYYATYAKSNRSVVDKLYNYPYEEVQKDMAEGRASPAFLPSHLEALDSFALDDRYQDVVEEIKSAAGTLYIAAADTTAAAMSIFFLAMVLHPGCQAKAQEEIDSVIGPGRLPNFSDRGSLPYVDCIVQETLRWHNVTPLGVPHQSIQDDVYRSMFIPKGSIIIANTRAMTLDYKIYADPRAYNPSRFLPKPEGNGEPYPHESFGFRRRVCPGRYFANSTLWIAIATILATFRISKAVGRDGKEVTPAIAFSLGGISHPRPYECQIRPRNDGARRLITQANISDR